jgi:hypothetical protein
MAMPCVGERGAETRGGVWWACEVRARAVVRLSNAEWECVMCEKSRKDFEILKTVKCSTRRRRNRERDDLTYRMAALRDAVMIAHA